MLPAPAQGAIGVEIRGNDGKARRYLSPLNDKSTETCVNAERAVLAALGGDCRTPLGALASLAEGRLFLDALVIRPDGSDRLDVRREGNPKDAAALGADAGAELKARAGADFLGMLAGKAGS